MSELKERQIADGPQTTKATVVREFIEREVEKSREEELLATFNLAARDLELQDREEREPLVGAFSNK